ncbi:MAG: hypothetical protein APF80_07165 [Alphaproteobacteria bacterium BRH_c36]|nr:MAG: hypothetical protein APF80_07165 [Alphaproteobacteria bacterium BRH_c36]
MGSVVEIGGLAGWAVLAAPLLLLAAALMMALFWPHRAAATVHGGWRDDVGPSAAPPSTSSESPPESGISNLADTESRAETLEPLKKQRAEPLDQHPPRPLSTNVMTTTATEDTAIDATPVNLTHRALREAPSATCEAAARALLDEALSERAAGNDTTAAECLRAAIIIATQSASHAVHAAARLELGDIVEAQGDLQTACEHWQMARSLFEDECSAQEAAKCEKRMIKNRCPTDWVLNQF